MHSEKRCFVSLINSTRLVATTTSLLQLNFAKHAVRSYNTIVNGNKEAAYSKLNSSKL